MPRDLTTLARDAASDTSPLERTTAHDELSDTAPDKQPSEPSSNEPGNPNMFAAQAQQNSKRDDVHPYTQTLTLSDVESCVILEEAAFPPQERATREKVSQSFFLSFTSHAADVQSCR